MEKINRQRNNCKIETRMLDKLDELVEWINQHEGFTSVQAKDMLEADKHPGYDVFKVKGTASSPNDKKTDLPKTVVGD